MNEILHLKGTFNQKRNAVTGGGQRLLSGYSVSTRHLINLKNDLVKIIDYWDEQDVLPQTLISVYYNKVAAKSNRIGYLFASKEKEIYQTIVGAKFQKDIEAKHIITHYLPTYILKEAIIKIDRAIIILNEEFNGFVDSEKFNNKKTYKNINFSKYGEVKTNFQRTIVDVSFIDQFKIDLNEFDISGDSIITLYKTNIDTIKLLKSIGINLNSGRLLDEITVFLDPSQREILIRKAPYLIAMGTEDISKMTPNDFKVTKDYPMMSIPDPSTEPTIGVIDTLFDEKVYFSKWVEYKKMVSDDIEIDINNDYDHGTAVTSIIVDGPSLNPSLDDGCGRFKVKHFGVSTGKSFSSFTIIRMIEQIIMENKDIKVWNLSLGANKEVHQNFISAEAAFLDKIQYENDVIFVVAGTNNISSAPFSKRVGAPADGVNALVVNSVDYNNNPASFTRTGLVLSFYIKPDVSYYGGGNGDYVKVCHPLGASNVAGTSFAAPWIARKLSYLIDVLGFNREIAKALIIDSATSWNQKGIEDSKIIGHGIVPIHINEIIKTKSDEIRFIVSEISEMYNTYSYDFPIPTYKEQYPFVARATLCYFPKATRTQGVDYTNTELDLLFGRIKDNDRIASIKTNTQNYESSDFKPTLESTARKENRKWDNVKHYQEELTDRVQPRKVYSKRMWGMSIQAKERLNNKDAEDIRFAVVVTLKEISGINRIEDFIHEFSLRGWLVNKIDVDTKIDIYQTSKEEIIFE